MRSLGRRLATTMSLLAVAALGVASVAVAPTATPRELDALRVQATPLPTPTPQPTPEPTPDPTPPPAMRTSGGGRGAGPWPTNGTVSLPTLGVHAPIVGVGINSRNEMQVPSNARDVAWWDQGGFPSPTNNAVLAGHISWRGVRGSFANISALNDGDPVVVTFGGDSWTFRVVWVRKYDRNTPETSMIMGAATAPSVTLITCGGTFDRRAGTHSHRWVARAELVSG